MPVFVQSTAPVLLTPATCKQLELAFQQLPQSHNAPAVPVAQGVAYNSSLEVTDVKGENGHGAGDFQSDSSMSETWASTSNHQRQQGTADYAVSSSNNVGTPGPATKTSNRPTGPRKPKHEAVMSPDEEERRRVRRERNKQAAAKCRQKRVDLTNQLMSETQVLEAEQARLKEEIESFRKEKDELEFILETHRAHCGPSTVGNRAISNAAVGLVSADVTDRRSSSVKVTTANTSLSSMPGSRNFASAADSAVVVSSSTAVMTDVGQATAALPSASSLVSRPVGVGCRPSTLPTMTSSRTAVVTTVTAGVNLLTVGLDSLADGHTGLTPLTGIPSGPLIVVGMPMATSLAGASDGSSVVNNVKYL